MSEIPITGKIEDRQLLLPLKPSILNLREGELVRAVVVAVSPSNRVSVRLKNRLLEAKSTLPLQEGEELLLQVELQEQGIRLRVVEGGYSQPERIRELISSWGAERLRPDEFSAWKGLIEGLPELDPLPELSTLKGFFPQMDLMAPGALKQLLESIGIFFEAKLRNAIIANILNREEIERLIRNDLKGHLLRIRQGLRHPEITRQLFKGKILPQELSRHIDRLIRHIEYYQLLSRLEESLHLFLPISWPHLKDAELVIKGTPRKPLERKGYLCIIRLELERIGRLLIHLFMYADRIHIKLLTDNERFKDLLQRSLRQLEERLTSQVKIGHLTVEIEKEPQLRAVWLEGLDITA